MILQVGVDVGAQGRGVSDRSDAADGLPGGLPDDSGGSHHDLLRSDVPSEGCRVDAMTTARHDEDRRTVGEEHEAVRDRGDVASDRRRGFCGRASGFGEYTDDGVDTGILEVT
ncbi:hypothetical protein GCM10009651_06730 [Microbacterium natoriense]